ncbi:EAL domain-containing protein [Sphingomicrobium marinum]|uniref:EAL domain-containing protein n=1 Tax=Sphingomicrobium marinum TaxID=1227950 RepID=UPI00223F413D|nr:EAL domain-containing protein [Sphingomicrobium marinum]
MSRARFNMKKPERRQRASLRDALLHDVIKHEDEDGAAIAEQRVPHLNHVPLMIAIAHLIGGAAIYAGFGLRFDMLAAIAACLLIDAIAFLIVNKREQLRLSPLAVTRAVAAYVAVMWAGWAFIGYSVDSFSSDMQTTQHVAFASIIAVMSIAAVASPPIAIVSGVAATFGLFAIGAEPVMMLAASALALTTSGYAIAQARTMIAVVRRRLVLEFKARQALRFVTEYETSGHGWFWETNSDGVLTYVSIQLADEFDCTPEQLLGRPFIDLLAKDEQEGDMREERSLGFHLSAKFPFADLSVKSDLPETTYWSLTGNPVFSENGRFMGFRGIGTDLTEQLRSEQEISRLARFDSLTGLPNRAMMRQTLDEAMRNAARRQKGCALFLIDLDRFKNVNDTLGHPVGDALLREVAKRLESCMGNHGQVGRLGGDEFTAVLPGTVETGLLESLSKTMIEQVSRPYQIEGHRITIGASIGIAIGDPGRSNADSLTRNADLALYAAKGAGRGVHKFYQPSMHSEATERQMLENDLRGAIERDELWVAYQPIVRAAGEDVCGFEALVRWDHPSRGSIDPERFMSIAEECGLIGKVGAWVMDRAVAEAAEWPDTVRIAINLSPIQFNDPKIVETIAKALQTHRMRAERLELEITEGVFLADSNATDSTFQRLKDLGVRLALDDFGTGYSSLGYLRKAPFDKIKIDKGFVRGASNPSSKNSAIIRAIVTLAESLGMDTTAEGVETHDDLALVRELGCSQIQGYIFGKPVEAEKARELALASIVEPEGYSNSREPRQRLMRRAIVAIDGEVTEIRLRNISAMGALVECPQPVSPGTELTIDIIGVGPVTGTVRWAGQNRFGIQFERMFDMARLVPVQTSKETSQLVRTWYGNRPGYVQEQR